jgi:hypothetical protein
VYGESSEAKHHVVLYEYSYRFRISGMMDVG